MKKFWTRSISGFYFSMLNVCQVIIAIMLVLPGIMPIFAGFREVMLRISLYYVCFVLLQHVLRMNEHDKRTLGTAVTSALLLLVSAISCELNSMDDFGITVACVILGDCFSKSIEQDNRELLRIFGEDMASTNARNESNKGKWYMTGIVILVNVLLYVLRR